MNNIRSLIETYLATTRMMQVATSVNDEPWNYTLYFAYGDDLSLYWISKPNARHSKNIAENPKVAGVIVYDQQPPQDFVRGLSFEGEAVVLSGEEEEVACMKYIQQLNREKTLLEDIRSGRNLHKLYKVKPHKFVLFDTKNFSKVPYQEYLIM
jgi:uncharacterized protein YhbP (UPF0306 family)